MGSLKLPTISDVLKHLNWLRAKKLRESDKDPAVNELVALTADKVISVWKKASIPVISRQQISKRIKDHHNANQQLKSLKRGGKSQETKQQDFVEKSRKLFDICACKCTDITLCKCDKEKQVPEQERFFLLDQRTGRKMIIGHLDVATTNKNIQRIMNKSKRRLRKRSVDSSALRKRQKTHHLTEKPSSSDQETGTGISGNSGSATDSSFELPRASTKTSAISLKNVASAPFRTGTSRRNVALIANAALEDFGLISVENKMNVIDKMKVTRSMRSLGGELQEAAEEDSKPIVGLYFDGRKDETKVRKEVSGKHYNEDKIEEHIVLVEEPGSLYLGHVTPKTGRAEDIANGIVQYLERKEKDLSELKLVGCDGTPVNTGYKGGVLRNLEVTVGAPLQRVICLLHLNELPLRHLMKALDGGTTGPYDFAGPIGRSLKTCEKLPICYFQPIEADWLEGLSGIDDLSSDQEYLFAICSAVSEGHCSPDLARKKPGPVAHSRWLTTACRLLRVYISTEEPSEALRHLAKYVVRVYAAVWFAIRKDSCISDGSRHFWNLMQRSRYLPEYLLSIVNEVLKTNSFFAHPENIMVAMVTDDDPEVRELGWRRIKRARAISGKQRKGTGIRFFVLPELQYQANKYFEMINWSNPISEPPLLRDVDSEELEKHIQERTSAKALLDGIPNHTQAVERLVKLVTEASASVCGEESRDHFIRAKIESRKRMPKYETKKDYAPTQE